MKESPKTFCELCCVFCACFRIRDLDLNCLTVRSVIVAFCFNADCEQFVCSCRHFFRSESDIWHLNNDIVFWIVCVTCRNDFIICDCQDSCTLCLIQISVTLDWTFEILCVFESAFCAFWCYDRRCFAKRTESFFEIVHEVQFPVFNIFKRSWSGSSEICTELKASMNEWKHFCSGSVWRRLRLKFNFRFVCDSIWIRQCSDWHSLVRNRNCGQCVNFALWCFIVCQNRVCSDETFSWIERKNLCWSWSYVSNQVSLHEKTVCFDIDCEIQDSVWSWKCEWINHDTICTVNNKVLIIVRSVCQVAFSLFKGYCRKSIRDSYVMTICWSIWRHISCRKTTESRREKVNTLICVEIDIVCSFCCCFSFDCIESIPTIILNRVVCDYVLFEHHITVFESKKVCRFDRECCGCFSLCCEIWKACWSHKIER